MTKDVVMLLIYVAMLLVGLVAWIRRAGWSVAWFSLWSALVSVVPTAGALTLWVSHPSSGWSAVALVTAGVIWSVLDDWRRAGLEARHRGGRR